MHQDVPYSGSNNEIVYLTQLEYDALTTAQKKNGKVYFVTDLNNPVLNAAGISYDNTNSSLIADDVQEAIDEIDSKIKITSPVACLAGDTDCTITDSNILTTSIIEPLSDPPGVPYTDMTITNGQVVIDFPALAQATNIKLKIIN